MIEEDLKLGMLQTCFKLVVRLDTAELCSIIPLYRKKNRNVCSHSVVMCLEATQTLVVVDFVREMASVNVL